MYFDPRFIKNRILILLAVPGLALIAAHAQAAALVFVSAAADQQIITYSLDEPTGALKELARVKLDGEPGALAVSPDKKLLFAAMRSTGKLTSLCINGQSGRLEILSTVEAGADPAQISVDGTGRFLLTAYYVAGKVSVHRIATDGKLSGKPHQELVTAEKAHAIVASPRRPYVFVPHTGPNAVYQFAWDAESGRLAANKPARIDTGANTGPRHLVWHPRHALAYIDNEQGNSVTIYRLETATGHLEPGMTASTLPSNYSGASACAEIKMHPTGKFLYVSNRGHDSIAMFAVSEDGQTLTGLGQQPTERTPRSLEISPSGIVVRFEGVSRENRTRRFLGSGSF